MFLLKSAKNVDMNKARYVYLNTLNQSIRNHGRKSTVWTRKNMNNVISNWCIFGKTISIPTISIMIVKS